MGKLFAIIAAITLLFVAGYNAGHHTAKVGPSYIKVEHQVKTVHDTKTVTLPARTPASCSLATVALNSVDKLQDEVAAAIDAQGRAYDDLGIALYGKNVVSTNTAKNIILKAQNVIDTQSVAAKQEQVVADQYLDKCNEETK